MRNKKLSVLLAVAVGVIGITAFSAMAEITTTPVKPSQTMSVNGMIESPNGELVFTKVAAPGDTSWIRVYDDPGSECAVGAVSDGGQGTLAPPMATWCWEGGSLGGGLMDTCATTTVYPGGDGSVLPGCFTHYDVYEGLVNQWHLDTFDSFIEGDALPDYTPWCGEFGDTLIWKNDYGYGPTYNYGLVLNLGKSAAFNATTGFTLGGVHMYDVEINYDYCYLEYSLNNDVNLAIWSEIARYGGTSFPDGSCSGTGGLEYGCAQFGAFEEYGPAADNTTTDLLVRWRFASDSAWDDEDASGGVHTDGAWRVDRVFATSIADGTTYPSGGGYEDFESGSMPAEWSAPSLPSAQLGGFWSGGKWVNGVPMFVDWWHLEDDPDYVNYGNTCNYSNNWMWVADDEAQPAQNQEDAYHYRLVTPVFECGDNNPYRPQGGPPERCTGVILEMDSYLCIKSVVGDVTDQQVRVFDATNQVWGQWGGDNYVTVGGCQFWNVDARTDWSNQLSATTDSIQFSWEFLDRCDYNAAGQLPCMGQHRKATYIVDNVSIGVFEATSTQWTLGAANSFIDSYARDVDMHSSAKENWELFALDSWEDEDSLQIEVRDFNGLKGNGVKIHWRISTGCGIVPAEGGTGWDKETTRVQGSKADLAAVWNNKVLNFSIPDDPIGGPGTKLEFNGSYRTRIEIVENTGYLGGGATLWPEGTVLEYFFTAEDSSNVIDTFPNRNSAARTSMAYVTSNWDRRADWPFEASILPCPTTKRALPALQNHKVLLVTSPQGTTYDVVADIDADFGGDAVDFPTFTTIWEESLDRLGIVYDRYDIRNSGVARGSITPFYSQPFDGDGYGGVIDHSAGLARRYNSVVWFFGRFNNARTVVDSTQLELDAFLDVGAANFSSGANIWIAGNDLCEDEVLSDPAFVDANSNNTNNSAYFWQTLAGLNPVAGGCGDDQGIQDIPGNNYYTLAGQGGTIFAGMTSMIGQWDCPILDNPDNGITANTATELVHVGATPTTFMETHVRAGGAQTPSKVVVSVTPLEVLTSLQARDCWTEAIMSDFGVGIPSPKADCSIDVDVPTGVPGRVVLHQNTPNPFNPVTKIRFSLPNRSQVELKIYDIAGREVKTLVNGELEASNNHEYKWLGKDNTGAEVGSGVYFYRLNAGKDSQTRKMVLIR